MSSYKYYKSDFAIIVNIGIKYTDDAGVLCSVSTDMPFVFRLYSPISGSVDNCYSASSVGTERHNCAILNDHKVIIFVDMSQHDFSVGELMIEAEFMLQDENYAGDGEFNIIRLYNSGIILTDKPDLDSEGIMTVEYPV